ncbi:MAG: MotA/TolQ/ExbB proton channel family protein [Betaproteobacteria bacterium]
MIRSIHHLAALACTALIALAAPLAVQAQDATKSAPTATTTVAVAETVAVKETVENPYGFTAMIKQGDMVSKGTLVILLIMSMGSWYIIFVKLWEQRKLGKQARSLPKRFWTAPSVIEGAAALKKDSAFRYIAETALGAIDHQEGTLTENIDRSTWVTMSVQRAVDAVNLRMQEGLAFLATVGSTAPFVGLFGTVWGILHALTSIGIAGQASIDKVAGPVGEALIMTAIGLAVAVPAVIGYNWLVRRNKVAMEGVRTFGADVHAVLMSRGDTAR